MAPPSIVKAFDKINQAMPCLLAGLVILSVNEFNLQRSIKALYRCVVVAVPLTTHTASQLVSLEKPLEVLTAVLTAAIAMHNQTWRWSEVGHIHL